jgi:recombination protein RecT
VTQLEKRTPTQELVAQIRGDQFLGQVKAALPSNVTPERFVRVTVTAINETPELVATDRPALFQALMRCAQDGLLPDGREAALVIFGGKAAYMPMIGGFRKIAAEHGWAIDTQVVYEQDTFDYQLGVTPTLTHKPPRLDVERGKAIGAYAIGTHEDGRKQVEVMTRADIERVRNVSKAKDRGPWKDWPDRMWEKTAGRRLFGKLPLGDRDDVRVARVISASDSEYNLGQERQSMTVAEADASASLPTVVPEGEGPDDYEPVEGEIVENGQEQFPIPAAARKTGRGA